MHGLMSAACAVGPTTVGSVAWAKSRERCSVEPTMRASRGLCVVHAERASIVHMHTAHNLQTGQVCLKGAQVVGAGGPLSDHADADDLPQLSVQRPLCGGVVANARALSKAQHVLHARRLCVDLCLPACARHAQNL